MQTENALCIKCGKGKHDAMSKCKACGFRPLSNIDKAKSLLLSTDCTIEEYSLATTDLARIGKEVADENYVFDDVKLQALLHQKALIDQVSFWRVLLLLIIILAFPLLGLLVYLWRNVL